MKKELNPSLQGSRQQALSNQIQAQLMEHRMLLDTITTLVDVLKTVTVDSKLYNEASVAISNLISHYAAKPSTIDV